MPARCWRILCAVVLVTCWQAGLCSRASAGDHGTTGGARRPNILFILLDNVGKDWFRCYGSQEDVTPNIDRLARTGIKFRTCYVTPVCSTTRVMLLTGRYPFTTGWHTHHDPAIYGGGYFDWNRETCIARVLQSAGYRTCISGKWQINDLFDPQQKDALTRHGFDEYCIFPEGKKGHPAHKKRYWDPYVIQNGKRLETEGRFGPDIFSDYLIDFFRRNRDRPFFAYYSTILTHIPVVPTPHNRDRELTPREQFAGMVSYADHLIGRLEGALEELGLRERTLIFITVDNGTDNGTDQKNFQSLGGRIGGRISGEGIYSLKERGINMPLIVNGPGIVPEGRESDVLIDATDFFPTLAELAGARLPADRRIDGRSFAWQLRGDSPPQTPRPWCLTQYYDTRVVRDQRFKLYSDGLYSDGEFYDLSEDPLEQHNLIGTPRMLDRETRRAYDQLCQVLGRLPPDAKLPWKFRSISARKIARDEAERAEREHPRRPRARELGIDIGLMSPGKLNAITDVPGVQVGHCTIFQGDHVRTGVTAIVPHGGNLFREKVPAAVVVGNGFGKLVGSTQVNELGTIETPIVLTNTLSVFTAANAVVDYMLALPGNQNVRSVNPIVGETNDGFLNDIRGRHVERRHVLAAIRGAAAGPVPEGSVGAGTGTRCLGFKGGIGTSSRIVSSAGDPYVVGVLVQSNFNGALSIGGAPIGQELQTPYVRQRQASAAGGDAPDGSCMIVVATNAPLNARQLRRLAKRALLGLAAVGSPMQHGSGDYVIAFSTVNHTAPMAASRSSVVQRDVLRDEHLSPLFQATKEATTEAVVNSLLRATTVTGAKGRRVEAIPIDRVQAICRKYGVIRDRALERDRSDE